MKRTRAPTTRRAHRVARAFLAVAAMALLLSWNSLPTVQASAGELDPGFGDGGKVTTSNFYGNALAIQPDGKIVTAGVAGRGEGDWDFCLVRYNPNGSPDPSFRKDGRATTDFFGSFDEARAVAILRDGRIVAAGYGVANDYQKYDFALARYNQDGSLDSSFGTGGKVLTNFSVDSDVIHSLAIQRDGRIVAAGISKHQFALARYNTDGSLDASFGFGGKVITDLGGEADAESVAIQRNGKIIVTGTIHGENAGQTNFVLVRYNSDGSLDSTFGMSGKVITDYFGSGDLAYAVVLQPDGRILAAGGSSVETGGGFFFALACYNSDGSLDSTFGEGGKVVTTVGDSGSARAALIQPDGKIVLAGGSISYTSTIRWDFAIVRFNSDGSLDATFGEGGKVITDFGDSDGALDLAIAPDGRLLAAGASGGLFALACYLNDLDLSVQITSAEVIGKKLYIYGKNFDDGAKVFLNGEKQKTAIDEANPTTVLIGKKAGKKIAPGQTVRLRVKCLDGRLSNEFRFTRPIE